ncbi:permease-like cell division protein FtsX [Methylosoma difficile]
MVRKRRSQTKDIKTPKPHKPVRQEHKQNRAAGGGLLDKLLAQRDLHVHVLLASLGRLLETPFASAMTIAVLAIAISLAGSFHLLLINAQQIAGNLQTSAQLSLFLKDSANDVNAKVLAEKIRINPSIQSVKVISKEQGKALFKSFGHFGSALDVLEENPLPIAIEVLPKNTFDNVTEIEQLANQLKQEELVFDVRMDMEWLKRLQSMMAVASRLAVTLYTLLGLAVLFITGNTIRLELNNRHDEIVISKLVGATNGFIQKPFLFTGFWIGFFAGVLAWFIVAIIMLFMRQPVEALSQLYDGNFHLLFLSLGDSLRLIFLSACLSTLGSWIVLLFQLQKTKPE